MSRNEKLINDVKLLAGDQLKEVTDEVFKLFNDNIKDDEKKSDTQKDREHKQAQADETCIKIQTDDLIADYKPLYDAMHDVGLSPEHKHAEMFLAELGSKGLFVFRMPKKILDEMNVAIEGDDDEADTQNV